MAAAHRSFPVLYKVDKQTGLCDVISMEWLLNHREGQETAFTLTKPEKPLETLLMNLASHQTIRPGLGVRLFVQGCVLAGCDYAPKLEGVGLFSAFKYVRDGADQEDTVRLQSILASLPQKILANIDATKHEETLAQSEAVFYYHVVTHQDRCNRPICEPRVSEIESGVEHSQDHHLPLMTRFEDSSFIGDTSSPGKSQPASRSSYQRKRSGKRVPIRVPEK